MTTDYPGIGHGVGIDEGASCRVVPRGDGLEIISKEGAHLTILPYRSLEISLTGVDDRYLCFAAPEQRAKVLVGDRSIIETIRTLGAPGSLISSLDSLTAGHRNKALVRVGIVAALLAAAAALVAFSWIGIGWATTRAVDLVPREWEQDLGRAAAREVLRATPACTDPRIQAFVGEIGTRLAGALTHAPFSLEIRVLDTDDVNAFALPGGYIFVNRGLIERADDGAEVAGVLAHEIEHVVLRHGLHNLSRQIGLLVVLLVVLGDTGGVEGILMRNAAELTSMSFSREQEFAADKGGLALLRAAEIDPTGLHRFLAKLTAKEGAVTDTLTILSTHPASAERIRRLEALAAADSNAAEQRPLRNALADVVGRCDPMTIEDPDGP